MVKKMTKDERSILVMKIIIYCALTYLLIFYILKAAGVINTPMWLEFSPHLVAILTLFLFLFKFYDWLVQLKDIPIRMTRVEKRLDKMSFGLTRVEKYVEYLKKDVHKVNSNMGILNNKFNDHLINHQKA